MKAQRVIHLDWVKEKCGAEAGATPVLRTSRVGSAALVAPATGTQVSRKYLDADTGFICAGYKLDQFSIMR
jgi:hypothetical protein